MKKKIVFIFSVFLLYVFSITAMAETYSKEIEVTLPQDYVQCTFYVDFEKDVVDNTLLISPKGDVYPFSIDSESNNLKCTLKNAPSGTYIVQVRKEVIIESITSDTDTDVTSTNEEQIAIDYIGKVNVTVKAETESISGINSELKLTKEISGLKYYWKDNNFVVEWSDDTVGTVNVRIVDSSSLQVLGMERVEGKSFSCPVDPSVNEVFVEIVPAESQNVKGAGNEFAVLNNYHPNASIEFEPVEYTNKDSIQATVTIDSPYYLVYENNGVFIDSTDKLNAGTHTIDIPGTVIGENNLYVYVVDDSGNMRSSSINFIKDIEPPILKIDNDVNGIQTYENTISITGNVSDFDSLIFRNNLIPVEWDGLFEINDITLRDGENTLEVIAKDLAGNEAVYRAVVTKLVKEPITIPWNLIIPIFICLLIVIAFILKKKRTGSFLPQRKNNNNSNRKKELTITDYIYLAVSVVSCIILFTFVFSFSVVNSNSMEPTLKVNEFLVINKLAFKIKEPSRGDIITFKQNGSNSVYIKRIIGLPGETISFIDGYVFVNDIICDESLYLDTNIETNSNKTFIVPEDSYFVMGDNRECSNDSRYWNNPYILKSQIQGKLLMHLDFMNIVEELTPPRS